MKVAQAVARPLARTYRGIYRARVLWKHEVCGGIGDRGLISAEPQRLTNFACEEAEQHESVIFE